MYACYAHSLHAQLPSGKLQTRKDGAYKTCPMPPCDHADVCLHLNARRCLPLRCGHCSKPFRGCRAQGAQPSPLLCTAA
eukprot:703921-Pelagomonas_calceolata.AAC.2